jgi:hypothetical protein
MLRLQLFYILPFMTSMRSGSAIQIITRKRNEKPPSKMEQGGETPQRLLLVMSVYEGMKLHDCFRALVISDSPSPRRTSSGSRSMHYGKVIDLLSLHIKHRCIHS